MSLPVKATSWVIGAQMNSSTTGDPFVGVVTVYVKIDTGLQVIGSVGGGICTHDGNGFYSYVAPDTETNGDVVIFTFTGPGAIAQSIEVPTITAAQAAATATASGVNTIPVTTLLTGALTEIRVARAGDVINPDDLALALAIFNELLDSLNADSRAITASTFTTYTLIPSHQPHTIGPTGDFVVASRPRHLLSASLILPNSIRLSMNIHDDDGEWWQGIRAYAVQSPVPRDLDYSAELPNGSIRIWPVPNTAYGLELQTDVQLAAVTDVDVLTLPQGYAMALRLTLAELLAPSFGQQPSPSTVAKAQEARGRAWATNDVVPNLHTRDAGLPGGRGGGYNYLTGLIE